jgi:hypothetical protein
VGASTLLMTLYYNKNWEPGYNHFVGNEGSCDAAGYGIRNIGDKFDGSANDQLASFKVYGNCDVVGLYEHEHYNLFTNGRQQFYRASKSDIGSYMWKRTTSLVVYDG